MNQINPDLAGGASAKTNIAGQLCQGYLASILAIVACAKEIMVTGLPDPLVQMQASQELMFHSCNFSVTCGSPDQSAGRRTEQLSELDF